MKPRLTDDLMYRFFLSLSSSFIRIFFIRAVRPSFSYKETSIFIYVFSWFWDVLYINTYICMNNCYFIQRSFGLSPLPFGVLVVKMTGGPLARFEASYFRNSFLNFIFLIFLLTGGFGMFVCHSITVSNLEWLVCFFLFISFDVDIEWSYSLSRYLSKSFVKSFDKKLSWNENELLRVCESKKASQVEHWEWILTMEIEKLLSLHLLVLYF